MKDTTQKTYLKDYQRPAWQVESLHLDFDLRETRTRVFSKFEISKLGVNDGNEVFLEGEGLKLISIKVNGSEPIYSLSDSGLKLQDVPKKSIIEIETEIKPQENTSLEGLYKSNGVFCTQCEAQGFRKITYFFDRPDVMTKYTVRIEADKKLYPVLLSNGDRVSAKDFPDGRHEVVWQDPFKKPSYLFALVAGDLGVIKDTFATASGKKVNLEIYAAHGMQARCEFAMKSLIKSMRWDEVRYGREYDLSTYMILAVDDFNAGAMENKGLNIFNSKLIFADSKTATDYDYFSIESVIAHEYFHNWTGNRVTLRDWFHLSLKEGLTVFRDQEFSMDQSSKALLRIENVDDLRNSQFAEDASGNAHPIRPASCMAVDNFFTSTIYEKGSEVIRMMQTMVGRPGFRKGMDLYFERHDGQAVIIEDFAKAISDANNQNWDQFKLWYSQAGTPVVKVQEKYDSSAKIYQLTLKQDCPLTAQEKLEKIDKKPFHIPLMIGLINSEGKDLDLKNYPFIVKNSEGDNLLHLKEKEQTFIFSNILEKPTLSLNRQFSSPIRVEKESNLDELLFLMRNDSDAFNRWESAQKIYLNELHNLIKNPSLLNPALPKAFDGILHDVNLDPGFKAKLMSFPSFEYLAQMEEVLDGQAFLKAHVALETSFAKTSEAKLLEIYKEYHGVNPLSLEPRDFDRRRLKNRALSMLVNLGKFEALALDQLQKAEIMTDQQSAFAILADCQSPARDQAIKFFHDKWKHENLVMNKWFSIQATANHPDTFKTVQSLLSHPLFSLKNPNRVYSLLRNFGGNISQFHRVDLDCYRFMADQIIELDKLNPQVAARVAGCFDLWTKLPAAGQEKARTELERLVAAGLSANTKEIVSKNLAATGH
jgi:aminopeptidase N